MAGRTVIHDAGVIKGSRQESGGLVTDMAILVGRHMVGRGYLARCRTPVMAGHAVIHDAGVIEIRTAKGTGVMTGRAVLGRTNRHVAQGQAS